MLIYLSKYKLLFVQNQKNIVIFRFLHQLINMITNVLQQNTSVICNKRMKNNLVDFFQSVKYVVD